MSETTKRDFLDSTVLARLSSLSVESRVPVLGSVSGIHKSATRGSSVEFAEYRKYVPGDDIRRVDWRVYGRTDRFYMKEFEADTNMRCYLVLDSSGSMAYGGAHGTKFNYVRKLAATLAWLLVHQGDAVGLVCFADKTVKEIAPSRSPAHLKEIFDAMEKIEPCGGTEIVKMIHAMAEKARHRAMVIVFSDFFAELTPLLDSFQHMRFNKHDLTAFHIMDKQEIDFQFDRPIRFIDAESGFSLITDPSVIRYEYQQELDRFLNGLEHGSREFGVDYRRVITEMDYDQALAAFLLERMTKRSGSGVQR